jgi:hypothetical protein
MQATHVRGLVAAADGEVRDSGDASVMEICQLKYTIYIMIG